jgi:hypothetical protein
MTYGADYNYQQLLELTKEYYYRFVPHGHQLGEYFVCFRISDIIRVYTYSRHFAPSRLSRTRDRHTKKKVIRSTCCCLLF